jgi:Ca-activated chloride channel homolog
MAASNSRPELYAGLAITEGMLVPNDRALPPVPLKHTDVEATIVGPLCDVALRQEFHNTHSAPIEALYVFPLPEDAAVSALTLTIGDHVVKGDIRERDAARNDYEQARDAGQGAALLEQHRPNLFGVSVTNIHHHAALHAAQRGGACATCCAATARRHARRPYDRDPCDD